MLAAFQGFTAPHGSKKIRQQYVSSFGGEGLAAIRKQPIYKLAHGAVLRCAFAK